MKNFAGLKVLVVDDDEMLREVVGDIFRLEGAEVTEAGNGTAAFSLVLKNNFDVVCSDVRMPGGDGITLAKNICEMAGQKPLVFICSGFNDLSPEKALELGILKVFEKPFNRKALIGEIARAVSESKIKNVS